MKFLIGFGAILFCFQVLGAVESSYELLDVVHTQENPVQPGPDVEDNSEEVSSEQLKRSNATSLDDILRLTPSATTTRGPRTAGEAPQVRGLDKNKIAVSIDGVRQNYQSGHTSMVPLDTETLKAVKVFKNAGDFSAGNSLGGGVVFKTIDPKDLLQGKKQVISAKTQVSGANSELLYNVKSAYQRKKNQALISYTSKTAQELKLSDGSNLPNSSFEEKSFMGKYKYGYFGITLSHFEREDDSPRNPSLDPPNEERYQRLFSDNTTTRSSVSLDYKRNYKRVSLDTQLYLNNHSVEQDVRDGSKVDTRNIQTIGSNIVIKRKTWLYGLEAYHDKLDGEIDRGASTSGVNSYPNAQSFVGTFYFQKQFDLNKLQVTPGLRLNHYNMSSNNGDFVDKSAEDLSKNLLVKYRPMKQLELSASYSEGFNSPRVNEVYPTGLHNPGDGFFFKDNYFMTNTNLSHETSEQWEGGLAFESHLFTNYDQIKFSYSRYLNDIQNYIYMERIDRSVFDEGEGTTQFVNLPDVRLEGDEATLRYINMNWDTAITYSRVRGRNRALDLWLEDLAADQVTFQLTYYLDKYKFSAGYYGIQTMDQDRVNPQTMQRTEETPGYLIHNVFANKELIKNLDLNLRVENLGNTKYRRHASHLFESREDVKVSLQYKVFSL